MTHSYTCSSESPIHWKWLITFYHLRWNCYIGPVGPLYLFIGPVRPVETFSSFCRPARLKVRSFTWPGQLRASAQTRVRAELCFPCATCPSPPNWKACSLGGTDFFSRFKKREYRLHQSDGVIFYLVILVILSCFFFLFSVKVQICPLFVYTEI